MGWMEERVLLYDYFVRTQLGWCVRKSVRWLAAYRYITFAMLSVRISMFFFASELPSLIAFL